MISVFCCSCHGFMKDDELKLKSYQIFLAGNKNREGWFTNDDLVAQLQKIMPLIEKLHPNTKVVFAFDNSMTHHARAPDGLEASLLPLKDNGENAPIMRNTSYIKDGVTHPQQMQILIERGEWKAGMLLTCKSCDSKLFGEERAEYFKDVYTANDRRFTNYCCARRCLSQQPDFLNQKEWLSEVVERNGHEIIFYPKYHCELNYIEMVWAYLKAKLRRECEDDFKLMLSRIPDILIDEIPIAFFRRVERHCLRFMSGYRIGLEGPLLDFAMKKYTSHRRLLSSQLGDINSMFELKQNK